MDKQHNPAPLEHSSEAVVNAQKLSDVCNRSAATWERLTQIPREERAASPTPVLLTQALDELAACLEALGVADEVLRNQNQALAESSIALETESRRYLDLFADVPVALLVTSADGLILEANRATALLLGLGTRFLIGNSTTRFIAKKGRVALLGVLLTAGGGKEWEGSLRLQPRKGGAFEAAVTVTPITVTGGKPSVLRWLIRAG